MNKKETKNQIHSNASRPKNAASKKTVFMFVGILIACFTLGSLVGTFSERISSEFLDIRKIEYEILPKIYYFFPMVFILLFAFAIVFYVKYILLSKSFFKDLDYENEDEINRIEENFNKCMLYVNFIDILSIIVFFYWIHTIIFLLENFSTSILINSTTIILFILITIICIVTQYQIVEYEKKLNPEKDGNILDPHFAKDWEGSLDEAEKLITYKSTYKAYKMVNSSCICFMILAIIGDLLFKTGFYAILIPSLILLISTSTYAKEGSRLENIKKN